MSIHGAPSREILFTFRDIALDFVQRFRDILKAGGMFMNTLGDRIRHPALGAGADAAGCGRGAGRLPLGRGHVGKGRARAGSGNARAAGETADVPMTALVEREEAPMPENLRPCARGGIPLLGAIAAGEPIFAEEEHETYVDVGDSVRADFALEVHGRSMEPVYRDGDVVYIRSQNDVLDGQVAAVVNRRFGHPQARLSSAHRRAADAHQPRLRAHALHRGKQRQRAHPWAGGGLFPQNGLTRAPSKRISLRRYKKND